MVIAITWITYESSHLYVNQESTVPQGHAKLSWTAGATKLKRFGPGSSGSRSCDYLDFLCNSHSHRKSNDWFICHFRREFSTFTYISNQRHINNEYNVMRKQVINFLSKTTRHSMSDVRHLVLPNWTGQFQQTTPYGVLPCSQQPGHTFFCSKFSTSDLFRGHQSFHNV